MSEQEFEQTAVTDGVEGAEEPSGSNDDVFVLPEVEIPAEILADLEEPDFEDEEISEDEMNEFVQEYGEENPELLARLRAAEKKAAYYEGLRQQEARKNWKAEAEKYWPLAAPLLDAITATSHRGFRKAAQDIHDKLKPAYEAQVKAAFEKAKTVPRVVEEPEPEVDPKEAWRNPTLNDTQEQTAPMNYPARPRRRGDLADTLRTMMFGGENGK